MEKRAVKNATAGIGCPTIKASQYFSCAMQGHRFIFAAINLNSTAQEIRAELMKVLAQNLPINSD